MFHTILMCKETLYKLRRIIHVCRSPCLQPYNKTAFTRWPNKWQAVRAPVVGHQHSVKRIIYLQSFHRQDFHVNFEVSFKCIWWPQKKWNSIESFLFLNFNLGGKRYIQMCNCFHLCTPYVHHIKLYYFRDYYFSSLFKIILSNTNYLYAFMVDCIINTTFQ
jgi:hypothetical protein